MPSTENHAGSKVAIGLRAYKGGALVVCVNLEQGAPRVVLSTAMAICAEGDRLSREPYRVASELPRAPDGHATVEAVDAVAEGRRRQGAYAADGLRTVIQQLQGQGFTPTVAALLINRAAWITDLLDYSLAWKEHVAVAELLAVRDALRSASAACGIGLVEVDEKSLASVASAALGVSAAAMPLHLKALGFQRFKPWRKEEKLACLAAWAAAARPEVVHP